MSSTEWRFPSTLEQALTDLRQQGSQPVAGGTTLLDLLKLGHPMPRRLVDISRLALSGITSDDGTITILALTPNTTVAESSLVRSECPSLSEAILLGASQQIRNAATVGGNLLQATRCAYFRTPNWRCNRRSPGSGCDAQAAPLPSHAVLGGSADCIAVNPSDMAVALLALDANVVAAAHDGRVARIALADFYPLPAETPHVTHSLPQDWLITAIEIPRTPLAVRSGYLKLRGRASYEFATASVAAGIVMDGPIVQQISVALGGVGTRPWRCPGPEAELIGKPLDPAAIDALCDGLLQGADVRPATRHKVALVRGAVHRLLTRLTKTET